MSFSGLGTFLARAEKAREELTQQKPALAGSKSGLVQSAPAKTGRSASVSPPSKCSSKTLSDDSSPKAANSIIHHYDHLDQVPSSIQKYWYQRHDIWYKYDEGVWMTDDGWFGVTPEPVAQKMAEQMAVAAPPQKTTIIDAFAGSGGNAIAFALSGRWELIIAIEKDPVTMKCAQHNAALYGVDKKIWFITDDCFEYIKGKRNYRDEKVVVFASPPWGGVDYKDDFVFDVQTMKPYSLHQLHRSFSKITKEVVLYLPRTSNLNQLAKYVPEGEKIQVAHYCMRGASKALCAYYGDFGCIR